MRHADDVGAQAPSPTSATDALSRRSTSLTARLTSPIAGAHGSALVTSGNSIGFLRFVLAALVVVHHTRILGGFGPDLVLRQTHGQADLGVIAVAGFFTLSGFLITRSAEHVSLPRYLWHRVIRIMPAFWVCLIVVAVVIGPLLWWSRWGTLQGYLGTSPSPAGYVVNNVALLINQVQIDDLLDGNPYPYGLNGSLWTLAYEFAWYLVVAILAGLRILSPRVVALLLFVAITEAATHSGALASVPVVGYALGSRFAISFATGMLAYLLRNRLPLDDRLAAAAAGVVALTLRFGGFGSLGMLALAYLILWAAWRLPFRRFGAQHDVSYGLYIYAFPMQQTLAALVTGLPYLAFMTMSFALTLPLAWASHVFVEAPAIRHKNMGPPAAVLRLILQLRARRLVPGEPSPVAVVVSPLDGQPPLS